MKRLYKAIVAAIHKWHSTRRCLRKIARICHAGNEVVVAAENVRRIKLGVCGKGNVVKIGKMKQGDGKIWINVYGDNCCVEIGDGLSVDQDLNIAIGANSSTYGKVVNCSIKIGSGTYIGSTRIVLVNSYTNVSVGSNCMFSFDITLYQTDMHPIYEFGTDKIVNISRSMIIGDRTWLGKGVSVLKNSIIPNGCIVGWGSVVSGKFTVPNSIICGNPARQIECRKVEWQQSDPRYITNEEAKIR